MLYYEYLKALGVADKRLTSAAVDYETFMHSMPFACFKPWSDNAPHMTEGAGNLVVNLTGGQTGHTIMIVTTRLCIIEISPDHVVRELL